MPAPESPTASPQTVATAARETIRVLCLEDNIDDIERIKLALKQADPQQSYSVSAATDVSDFSAALDAGVDVVLCDSTLQRFSPVAALAMLAARQADTPLVVLTHPISDDCRAPLMRDGAKGYITKDKLAVLHRVISRVERDRLRDLEERQRKVDLQVANRRLKEMSSRFLETLENERAMLSRELHDVLGQTLTAIVIHLHAAQSSPAPQTRSRFINQALEIAKTAIQQVKALSFSLRPPAFDVLGLVSAVQAELQRLAEPAGLQMRISVRGTEPAELGDNALVALRVIQEAVTNTLRHARATRVAVLLRFTPAGRIVIVVGDNGIGFDQSAVLGKTITERNLGLNGMIERADLVGGCLRFRTRPGAGVIVKAVL